MKENNQNFRKRTTFALIKTTMRPRKLELRVVYGSKYVLEFHQEFTPNNESNY